MLAALSVAALLASAPAHAQQGFLLQGIIDAEAWKTDTLSTLLIRNSGRAGGVGRMTLWSAYAPMPSFFLYAEGQVEGGNARVEGDRVDTYLDEAGVRYVRSDALVVDAGKMPGFVGSFAPRRFSTRNPLIGMPDGYPLQYPVGVEVSGAMHAVDYRAGIVSLPISHEFYTPEPTASPRPAAGLGITPMVGLRVGVSGTVGPYLNSSFTSAQLAGNSWQHYQQRIGSVDAQFSRGYLELHGEVGRGAFDVPGRASSLVGTTWYADAKYTLTPRLFLAVRQERNDYPFISEFGPTARGWVSRNTDFHDTEAGLGYRLSATTLLKASYRWDKWVVDASSAGFLRPGGNALAFQLSQAFDAVGLIQRQRGQ